MKQELDDPEAAHAVFIRWMGVMSLLITMVDQPYQVAPYDAVQRVHRRIAWKLAKAIRERRGDLYVRDTLFKGRQYFVKNWINNDEVPKDLRDEITRFVVAIDALDRSIFGGWRDRHFPMLVNDNDE